MPGSKNDKQYFKVSDDHLPPTVHTGTSKLGLAGETFLNVPIFLCARRDRNTNAITNCDQIDVRHLFRLGEPPLLILNEVVPHGTSITLFANLYLVGTTSRFYHNSFHS
jgi:hypothetical protein